MSQYARVDSVEALKEFRGSLCKFVEVAKAGLSEAEGEVLHTAIWLRHDQQSYWKGQIRKRSEKVAQAKIELTRKKYQKTPLGGRYPCVDEEKALAAAKRRLEEAEQKLENVRRWMRQLEEETSLFKGQVQGLSFAVEADMPNAIARLDNMIDALQSYASFTPPKDEAATTSEPSPEQPGPDEATQPDPTPENQSDPPP